MVVVFFCGFLSGLWHFKFLVSYVKPFSLPLSNANWDEIVSSEDRGARELARLWLFATLERPTDVGLMPWPVSSCECRLARRAARSWRLLRCATRRDSRYE